MLPLYTQVRLTTNKYQKEGGTIGMLGFVIESYPDGKYEIEFSDANGITIAQLVASDEDLIAVPQTNPKE